MSSKPALIEFPLTEARKQLVYLAEFDGEAERSLLQDWLAKETRGDAASRAIFYERPHDAPLSPTLVKALRDRGDLGDSSQLAPLRVVWRAGPLPRLGMAAWRQLLLGRTRGEPSERVKRRLARSDAARWQVVAGEPAPLGDLRGRWEARGGEADAEDFAQFVARQAELALDRAEYHARGARYKLPRVFKEDVASSTGYRRGLAELASTLDRDVESVRKEALTYLDELRTAHDPFVLDLAAKAFHKMYAKGYGEVDIDPAQIEMLRATFARHAVILLPSHKTNLDSPIVESVLAQQNLPPPTLFAGINMSYWPIGPLMRRAGRVFLRRKIGANPVYKFALREWLAYLIEKRFNLEWFPEGTRSRTGKLLPPKLGLLSYAADAYRQGGVDDLMLVPMSIIYDQAFEVAGFAREALGEQKKAESLGWMMKSFRELGTRQGKVYLRIAEPLSMREALGAPDPAIDGDGAEARLALHKLALAVAWRTNQVTPITGIAIVAFALLAAGDSAVTLDRILPYVRLLVREAELRGQPLTESARITTDAQVEELLSELVRTGVVTRHDGLLDPLYSIARGQHLAAAFYRNSLLHFVLDRAIGELAALMAAKAPHGTRKAQFWDHALRLREALKFEFFFQERAAFERELADEMALINRDWAAILERGDDVAAIHREIFGIGIAHAVLRPFVEAYHIVLLALLREPIDREIDEKQFIDNCQKLGRQMLLQRELRNPEAVSRPLFATGVQLIRNLKLALPGPDLAARREQLVSRSMDMLALLNTAEEAR